MSYDKNEQTKGTEQSFYLKTEQVKKKMGLKKRWETGENKEEE